MELQKIISALVAASVVVSTAGGILPGSVSAFAQTDDGTAKEYYVIPYDGSVKALSVYEEDGALEASTILSYDSYESNGVLTLGELEKQYAGFSAGDLVISDSTIPGLTADDVKPYVFVQYGDSWTWYEKKLTSVDFADLRASDSTINDSTVIQKIGLHMYINDQNLLSAAGAEKGKTEFINLGGKSYFVQDYTKLGAVTLNCEETYDGKGVVLTGYNTIQIPDLGLDTATVGDLKKRYSYLAVDHFEVSDISNPDFTKDNFYCTLVFQFSDSNWKDYQWMSTNEAILDISAIDSKYDDYILRSLNVETHVNDMHGLTLGDSVVINVNSQSDSKDWFKFVTPNSGEIIASLAYDDENKENAFWFNLTSSGDVNKTFAELAADYKGISWGDFDITSASLEGVDLGNIEYKIFVDHGVDKNDWNWTEIDGREITFDALSKIIPLSNYCHFFGVIVRLPVSAESGLEPGEMCSFNGSDHSRANQIYVKSGPIFIDVTDVNRIYTDVELFNQAFTGIGYGRTTLDQLHKMYDSVEIGYTTINSCSLGKEYCSDFSYGIKFTTRNGDDVKESLFYSTKVELENAGISGDSIIENVSAFIYASDGFAEKSGVKTGDTIVLDGYGELFNYKYDGSTLYMPVIGYKSYSDVPSCVYTIDLLKLIREKYGDINTIGELRSAVGYLRFEGFSVDSLGGDIPEGMLTSSVPYIIAIQTDGYSHWYSSYNTFLDLCSINADDSEVLDCVNIQIQVSSADLETYGLKPGDMVIVNPGHGELGVINAGIGEYLTGTVVSNSAGELELVFYPSDSIDIPGVTYGVTTFRELQEMYSALYVKNLQVKSISDSRLKPGNVSEALHLQMFSTDDDSDSYGAVYEAAPLFWLNNKNKISHYVGDVLTEFDIDPETPVSSLLLTIDYSGDLEALGFSEGDKVTIGFYGYNDDESGEWDSDIHIDGSFLKVKAPANESKYKSGDYYYAIFIDGVAHIVYPAAFDIFTADSEGYYNIDLVKEFATSKITNDKVVDIDIRVLSGGMDDVPNMTTVLKTDKSVPYDFKMGHVLDSVHMPVLNSWYWNDNIAAISVMYDPDVYCVVAVVDGNNYATSYMKNPVDGKVTIYCATGSLVYLYSVDKDGNRSKVFKMCMVPEEKNLGLRVENNRIKFNKTDKMVDGVIYRVMINDLYDDYTFGTYDDAQDTFVIPLLLASRSLNGALKAGTVKLGICVQNENYFTILKSSDTISIDYAGAKKAANLAAPQVSYINYADKGVVGYYLTPVDGAVGYLIRLSGEESFSYFVGTTYLMPSSMVEELGAVEVYAVDASGSISDCTVIATEKTEVPSNVTAEAGTNGIKVTWNAVIGATKYRVQRSTNGGSWSTISYPKTNEYTDANAEPGVEYRYRVLSYDGAKWSAASAAAAAKIEVSTVPENVEAAASANGIKVTWDAVDGAAKYRVQRSESGGSWSTVSYPTEAYYNDADVKAGVEYSYRVLAYCADKWSAPSAAAAAKVAASEVPENVNAEAGTNGIKVTWDAVDGVAKYRVQRSANGGSWSTVSYPKTTEYMDANVEAGVEYKYRVLAYNGTKWSAASEAASAKIEVSTVPENIRAEAGTNSIRVTWDAVDSATKYRVQRSANGGSWSTISYPTEAYYNDASAEPGVEYSYRVLAYVGGKWSAASEADKAKLVVSAVPENVVAEAGANSITVTWDAVDGALKYRVQRRTSGGSWSTISYPTEAYYSDTTAEAGVEYSYRVLAYAGGKWSAASEADSAKIAASTVPENIGVKAGASSITVTWDAVDGATKYRVQRSANGGSWSTVSYPKTPMYNDTSAAAGVEYSYRVLAYVGGAWSSPSEAESAMIEGSTTPENISAEAGEGAVMLEWDAVDGAAKYRVQRRTNGGSWSTVSYPTKPEYTDVNVVPGTEYGYRVLAYVGGKWSAASKAVTAVPFDTAD